MTFKAGTSGNPSGRPKENPEVKELARTHSVAAMQKLVGLMTCGDPRTELAAANSVLDRGWGKPAQAITGAEGGPIEFSQRLTDDDLNQRIALLLKDRE